jgi:hypothetical protein
MTRDETICIAASARISKALGQLLTGPNDYFVIQGK